MSNYNPVFTTEELVEIIIEDVSGGIVHFELEDKVVERNIKRAIVFSVDYFNHKSYKTMDIIKTTGSGGYVNLTELDEHGIPVITSVFPSQGTISLETSLLGLGSMFVSTGEGLSSKIQSYANVINKFSQLESILGRNARVVGDKLFIDKYLDRVTIEYIPRTVKVENIVEGTWIRWIIDYATALTKMQLAHTRGKFVVASNPSSINAPDLLDQAVADKTRLEEELTTKGTLRVSR